MFLDSNDVFGWVWFGGSRCFFRSRDLETTEFGFLKARADDSLIFPIGKANTIKAMTLYQLRQFVTSLECHPVTFYRPQLVTSNSDIKFGHFEEPGIW